MSGIFLTLLTAIGTLGLAMAALRPVEEQRVPVRVRINPESD